MFWKIVHRKLRRIYYVFLDKVVSRLQTDFLHKKFSFSSDKTNNPIVKVTQQSSQKGPVNKIKCPVSLEVLKFCHTELRPEQILLKDYLFCPNSLAHDCYDSKLKCGQWAREGLCNKMFWNHFMEKYCPQACGHCSGKCEIELKTKIFRIKG